MDLDVLEISDRDTSFEHHASDDEHLWDAIAILDERKGHYLVKWAGVDEHGKPWADSWTRKRDCTDDMVEEWKRKKALKKREKKSYEKPIKIPGRVIRPFRVQNRHQRARRLQLVSARGPYALETPFPMNDPTPEMSTNPFQGLQGNVASLPMLLSTTATLPLLLPHPLPKSADYFRSPVLVGRAQNHRRGSPANLLGILTTASHHLRMKRSRSCAPMVRVNQRNVRRHRRIPHHCNGLSTATIWIPHHIRRAVSSRTAPNRNPSFSRRVLRLV
ncbi:hypothetical protein C8R45DRAFT_304146 [Mycena sanguinolenta]|nr:hypothetical protein C8R45DRAFT_304146 [Mycena sanguinolenta]